MTNTTLKRFSTAIATGAVLLSSVAPAAFAADSTVSGNGAFSSNTVTTNNTTTTTVGQNNVANVSNSVSSNASTGGNTADFNTGGNTTIQTGDATNLVNVSNDLNTNQAAVSGCGSCLGGNASVDITDNGAFSTNEGSVNNNTTTALTQTNQANVVNAVSANSSTGKNDAGFNTGGNVTIKTGNAGVGVTIDTMANSNVALVGGGMVGAGNGSSITISGNGAFSENAAALNKNSAVILGQTNAAEIVNAVEAGAATGDNSAGFNTGGIDTIWTGNATTLVGIDNAVNFNAASVDCGCILGGSDLKVAGNGAYSGSDVTANDVSTLGVGAVNLAALHNGVAHDATTGANDAGFNTAAANGDPAVHTGNAYSSTEISNSGNENVFTQGATLSLPGNWNMSLNFDLMSLWMGMMHLVN